MCGEKCTQWNQRISEYPFNLRCSILHRVAVDKSTMQLQLNTVQIQLSMNPVSGIKLKVGCCCISYSIFGKFLMCHYEEKWFPSDVQVKCTLLPYGCQNWLYLYCLVLYSLYRKGKMISQIFFPYNNLVPGFSYMIKESIKIG